MTAWLISIGPWYTILVALAAIPAAVLLVWALVLILKYTNALPRFGAFIVRKAEELERHFAEMDDEPFDPEWMEYKKWQETRM